MHRALLDLQSFFLQARGCPGLAWTCSYSRSNSSLELVLTWAPKATVLGVKGAACCAAGYCSSSYWGSSSSDGGPSSERYGGGGRSNHGGRLREETKRLHQHSNELGKSLWVNVEWLVCISERNLWMQTQDNELPELLASLFSSPDIPNSLWVRRQRVCGESGGVKATRQQLHCVWAVLAWRGGGVGHEALWVEVALVQDD